VHVVIDIVESLFEPADVLEEVALDGRTGEAEAILLGGEHADQLATSGEQAVEDLRRFVR